ncbi:MAG: hypothetical protein FWF27_00925 [Candidatus Bathyarchaeota archaeon]|nr:hypothetical protein [Candidatus Termiticorpusculum sp.]
MTTQHQKNYRAKRLTVIFSSVEAKDKIKKYAYDRKLSTSFIIEDIINQYFDTLQRIEKAYHAQDLVWEINREMIEKQKER